MRNQTTCFISLFICDCKDFIIYTCIQSIRYKARNNTGLKLNIALNYGSRAEVVRACNTLMERGKPVDEADLMNALYTAGLPDLDLIIRTAGEQRLSNFMLLQAAYAELVFTDVTFPELTGEKYANCIREYQRRTRRFGAVTE